MVQNHQSQSRDEADYLKKNAVDFLQTLDAAYQRHFSVTKLSEVQRLYQQNQTQNPAVEDALRASQDAVAQALEDMATLEDYIVLHVPQMEDGNNFGVTVQLAALKQLKETSEALHKLLDDMAKYYGARADAMDKLNLESESSSETKKEENDGKETKTTLTKESVQKKGQQTYHRVQAVYAVDTLYYAVAKKAFRAVKSAYIANLDFLLKNKEKLESPKGSGGGSNYASMF